MLSEKAKRFKKDVYVLNSLFKSMGIYKNIPIVLMNERNLRKLHQELTKSNDGVVQYAAAQYMYRGHYMGAIVVRERAIKHDLLQIMFHEISHDLLQFIKWHDMALMRNILKVAVKNKNFEIEMLTRIHQSGYEAESGGDSEKMMKLILEETLTDVCSYYYIQKANALSLCNEEIPEDYASVLKDVSSLIDSFIVLYKEKDERPTTGITERVMKYAVSGIKYVGDKPVIPVSKGAQTIMNRWM